MIKFITIFHFSPLASCSFTLFPSLYISFPAIGAIFSATDSVCTLQVLNQDETPLLYSLVFGEGVVNDATSVVLFNAIQTLDLEHLDSMIILKFIGNFLYLFASSTLLGLFVSLTYLCILFCLIYCSFHFCYCHVYLD